MLIVSIVIISVIAIVPSVISEITKHVHSYGEWERFRNPTCSAQGIDRRFCDCGDTQEKAIDRLEHTPGNWIIDYDKNQNKLYCSVCNQVIQTISLEDHTHSFGEWIIEIEATCTNGGVMARYCICGAKEEKSIKVLDHVFGPWKTITEPTCTEYGLIQSSCSCGKVKEETVAMLDHQFVSIVTTREPTCSQTGIKEKTCSICSNVIVEELPVRIHDMGEWVITQEANCQKTGIKTRTCKNCDYTEEIILSTNDNHNYSEWIITLEPTTSTEGSKQRECSICGKLDKDSIDKLEYNPNCWTITENGKLIEVSSEITGDVNIPSNVIIIGKNVFANPKKITTITMSNSVTTIEANAFNGCKNVSSIKLSTNINSIGQNAFAYCDSLTSIRISGSISSIGKWTFDNCSKLSTIYFGGTMDSWERLMTNISWKLGISNYQVVCSDGTINIADDDITYQ